MSENFIQKINYHLQHLLKKQGIHLSQKQLAMIAQHAETLMVWNRKINLTAIKDPFQIAEKHFYDSIMAGSFLSKEIISIADIGSGGGFPGIPLKIIKPEIKLLMIDASQKKVNFLKHMIHLLELEGAEAVHIKLEPDNRTIKSELYEKKELDRLNIHNQFDAVISRALTDMESLTEIALPFLKTGGRIYSMKAGKAKKEITRTLKEKFKLKMQHYILPGEKADRYLIELMAELQGRTSG